MKCYFEYTEELFITFYYGWEFGFALVRMYVPKYCVCNSFYTSWWILFILTHSDQLGMEMTATTGLWDAGSFAWVMGLCHFFYYIAYRGNILCAQLLLHPLMDCVHTHTQRPTWHGDGFCDAASFTWVMGLCQFI